MSRSVVVTRNTCGRVLLQREEAIECACMEAAGSRIQPCRAALTGQIRYTYMTSPATEHVPLVFPRRAPGACFFEMGNNTYPSHAYVTRGALLFVCTFSAWDGMTCHERKDTFREGEVRTLPRHTRWRGHEPHNSCSVGVLLSKLGCVLPPRVTSSYYPTCYMVGDDDDGVSLQPGSALHAALDDLINLQRFTAKRFLRGL